ncbi:Quorum-sensing regulator [Yersinia intermedia]|uniref:mRNA interferase MqsR n=1 Tax=Yersinia intermedia TaxID=631 RepID=A0A209A7Q2_YERIN|nr:type II toxin-antitoxin system MqsR family toxin [Yersinia intermedia]OVZ88715.1 mRNA interferase MqsR [Yersinia intermedia]CNC69824.1 Quorum-sensing regulator [Yersinia intermedia]CNH20721.1 Quorum-sensing regulator [Yersinia intermedia]CQJ66580.1 Quorum-sensing regulator [Yersinia intermedia]
MEKRTPHTRLLKVKELVLKGNIKSTRTARDGAEDLVLSLRDMCDVVCELTSADFYKRMTTHQDHTIWQDVYRPILSCSRVYLKITVIDDVLIVSFKEL